jgi:hypothetical protein
MAFPNHPFTYPSTPSKGAWGLATSIIARTDLNQTRPICSISIADVFEQTEGVTYTWVDEATSRAMAFVLTVYQSPNFKKTDYDTFCIFPTLRYRSNPDRIEAELHHRARPYLKKMQLVIHKLYEQNMLTPENLAAHMNVADPLAVFKMEEDHKFKFHPLSIKPMEADSNRRLS